jgi:hypothetical protein
VEASVEGSLSASAERLVCRHAVARVAEPRRHRTGALGVVFEASQAQDAMNGSPLASWYEPLTPEPNTPPRLSSSDDCVAGTEEGRADAV